MSAASTAPLRVVIIGGGLTGYAAAIALLDRIGRPIEIELADAHASRGGGVAYGRAGPHHILNIRAAELTANASRPGDFVDWLEEARVMDRPVANPPGATLSHLFMPRSLVQSYMADRLDEALARNADARLRFHDRTVQRISILDDGYRVHLNGSAALDADIVMLATGYGARPAPRFGLDPFAPLDEARLARAGSVGIVGAGLTMIDACVTLRRGGYDGPITVFSRHGRLPEPHVEQAAPDFPSFARAEPDLPALFRTVRRFVELARSQSVPWQSVINALRRDAHPIWTGLSPADRRRFLRHVRPVWDRVRHRVPGTVRAWLEREMAEGLIIHIAARAGEARSEADGWSLCYRPRGESGIETARFDLLFDCTGLRPFAAPDMIAELEQAGRLTPDPLGLGIAVRADGAVTGADGEPARGLFALGPLGQGSLMEITAAPEIVAQARQAALRIGRDFACPKPVAARASA